MNDLQAKQREMKTDQNRIAAIGRRMKTIDDRLTKLAHERAEVIIERADLVKKWGV